jgi:hypothetical protein
MIFMLTALCVSSIRNVRGIEIKKSAAMTEKIKTSPPAL